MPPINKGNRLNSAATDIYLATSAVALTLGVLSWDQYLLRLRFLRENAEADSLQTAATHHLLGSEDVEAEDEWPLGEPEQTNSDGGSSDAHDFLPKDDDTGLLYFQADGSTGLSQWSFHLGDADFFPSIPHGHTTSGKRKKLDAYRGWIYRDDKQDGREPRWKIVALWNDEKFRAFASTSIAYYVSRFPHYGWRVSNPMRLPRRR